MWIFIKVVDVCLVLLIFSLTTFGLFNFLTLIIVSIVWSELFVMLFIFTSYDMLRVFSLSILSGVLCILWGINSVIYY